MIEAPDPSRDNGKSALDFAYWIHESVEGGFDRTTPFNTPQPDYEYIDQEWGLVRDSLERIGIQTREVADDQSNLGELVARYFSVVPKTIALNTRGALLYLNGRIAVCMGFKFVVHYEEENFVYRYMSEDELEEWNFGMIIKGVTYR